MIEVRTTPVFDRWFGRLRDQRVKAQVIRRIERMEAGNPGDVAAVGGGVSEMRIHHGPGYRLYFQQRGPALVILLCAGDKGSQTRDIVQAIELARELDL